MTHCILVQYVHHSKNYISPIFFFCMNFMCKTETSSTVGVKFSGVINTDASFSVPTIGEN
jgi:hypothetical protein